MVQLDNIDKTILALLQEDAKMSHKEISNKIFLTRTPVFDRIKKMERRGIISKYITLLNPKKIDKGLMVFCFASITKHGIQFVNEFQQEITRLKPVMECYHIAGNFDFIMKVVVKDIDEYQNFVLKGLSNIRNISNIQSSFILGELKYTLSYDLAEPDKL